MVSGSLQFIQTAIMLDAQHQRKKVSFILLLFRNIASCECTPTKTHSISGLNLKLLKLPLLA